MTDVLEHQDAALAAGRVQDRVDQWDFAAV